ncbi:unnamed protein product [Prunus armeniaca]
MFQMNIPKRFWSQGVLTATYLINHLPSKVLDFRSPLEVMKGRKIDLSHLKVFGCTCFIRIQASHQDKLDPRAIKCMFLGYSSTQKGLPTPAASIDSSHPMPSIAHPSSHEPEVEIQNEPVEDSNNSLNHHEDQSNIESSNAPLRRNPMCDRHPPSRLQDYVTYTVKHSITNFVSYHKFSPHHAALLSVVSSAHDPQSFQDANLQAVWRKAMQEELQALDDNNTWSVVKLPKGKKAVGSRWIYKTKFHSDGSIERYKARLVARGFTQMYGVDYKETFAPVAKMNIVRVLLSIVFNKGWPL